MFQNLNVQGLRSLIFNVKSLILEVWWTEQFEGFRTNTEIFNK